MNSTANATQAREKVSWEVLVRTSETLPRAFYEGSAVDVARGLLGKILVHGMSAGRIVEVEAYLGSQDRAAHAWHGLTGRTRVLFGQPGHAYVYLVYGMHECLNVVAEPEGSPGCILVRAIEPLVGFASMRRRRPTAHRLEDIASGPAKLTRAMGITRRHNGADLTSGRLTIRRFLAEDWFAVEVTPRVGVRQAADWPLRFLVAGSRFASC